MLSKRSKVANQYPVITDNQGLEEFVVGLLIYILEKLLKKIECICILCVDLEVACNGG